MMRATLAICAVGLSLAFATPLAAQQAGSPTRGSEPSRPGSRLGDTYEITMNRVSAQKSSSGSSGSSRDRDTIIERVVRVRPDGLELEYDLPKAVTAEERADAWQFPVRVFKPRQGPLELLNRPELEARVEGWLKTAKLTRADCGRWIFTWNAFRIECDPQSVIKPLQLFDLRSPDLSDGASYQETGALGPGRMARKTAGRDGAVFVVEMNADPDAVRRERAEADVVVGEIMKAPVTLDAALRERAKEAISGTISVTFDTDSTGNIRRRTKVTKLEIKADGELETQTVTETVERRLISRANT